MTPVTAQTTIRAPRSQVFSVFTDFALAAERVPGIARCELLTEGETGVGTRWKETRVFFGQEYTEEREIVDFLPEERYTLVTRTAGTLYRTRFIFQEENHQTTVTMIFEATPRTWRAKWMGFFMGLLMTGSVRRLLEADLQALKRACETRGVGSIDSQSGTGR